MDEAQAAELEAALNRLDPLVVRRAMEGLRNHPLRQSYRILSFATGAANTEPPGVRVTLTPDRNYVFRLTFSESVAGFDLPGKVAQPSFNEVTLSPDSLARFAEALRDVLRQQGWHG